MTTATVIVCTRDRAESCRNAISLLLDSMPESCELIVVDQSRDDATRSALAMLDGWESVQYLRSFRQGLSAARNVAAAAARGDLLIFTDDDCIPDADWITVWEDAVAPDGMTGVGFGEVLFPPFDPTQGYTSGFATSNGSYGVELFSRGAGLVGMGANMAVPKRVWQEVGGFDEGLGAGTRFAAGEDLDFAYRAVKAGYRIQHVTAARVWHLGYRQGASASHLVRGYVAGIAAVYAKHARCGDLNAVRMLVADAWRQTKYVTGRVASRTRPLGVVSLLYLLRGFGAAWMSPIDRRRRLYSPKEAAHAH
ncbi:MAG: glycosyltransferase family 2 protein [Candidatus Dormibacteraceae bacterium]